MIKPAEISEKSLIIIRITALELMYRDTYKTINFANKILLEIELGKAYNQLTKNFKNDKSRKKTTTLE